MNAKLGETTELLGARIAIGLAQGALLYLLYHAAETGAWPATQPLAFVPLLLVCLAVPVGLNISLGAMPWRTALAWVAGAGALLALLGFFDAWMNGTLNQVREAGFARPFTMPSWQIFVFGGGALFIAQALFAGGAADHRFRARYPTHFDVAWKLAVQLALAALFTGIFWLLLWLGAGLFQLIKLDFLKNLLGHEWFAIPMLSLAVAGGLHLTDIRPALVQGARTLLLTLLSWLLPVVILLVGGFVASLPFTGLAPLWAIGHATALLLAAAAVLIVLINAAYQDGAAERLPPQILRLSAQVAALLTVPLTVIAAYALYLRINQYGWTVDRVTVAAILLVALSYAGSYAYAAVAKKDWLKGIEAWNFNVALLALALVILLFTPLLSPQRIAVNDQMARLRAGKTEPQKFDFAFLRRHGGRFGEAALSELAQDRDAVLRRRAQASLARQRDPQAALTAQALADQIAVYPKGAQLPAGFLAPQWRKQIRYGCLASVDAQCDAVLVDLDGDGGREVLLLQFGSATVFAQTGDGWKSVGTLPFPANCPKIADALKAGNFRAAPPARIWNDIVIAELRLPLQPDSDRAMACPK